LPWLLLLLSPLGWLPFDIATRLWLLLNIILTAVAILLLWRLATASRNKGGLCPLLAGFMFGGTLAALHIGQITILVLLGLVMSLWLLNKGRELSAGAFLLLATIKPHLTYLVLLLMFLWILYSRRWKVLGGAFLAGGIAVSVSSLVFPTWFRSYFGLVSGMPLFIYSTTTVGALVRALWGTDLFRFAGFLLIPVAFPLVRLVERQGWLTSMSLALLLSLPLAPHGFIFDHILLLPAIVQLVGWLQTGSLSRRLIWILSSLLVIIYGVLLGMLILPGAPYHYFVWVPFALLALYVVAWRRQVRLA
jgi:hypothetical protein